jgi:CPA2 family monovalent cation:H+ antiporter-2
VRHAPLRRRGAAAGALQVRSPDRYPVAGIVLGPRTPGLVADVHLAPQLAGIGVMLLMFDVGTHFTLRDLTAVKAVAAPGAVAQILHWRRSASSPSSSR